MDPIVVLILVLLIVLVGIAIISSRRTGQSKSPQDENMTETFDFDPTDENIAPLVRRRTRVIAPGQMLNGTRQRIRVVANPLPPLENLVIPEGKGINSLDILVFNPSVRFADSDQELNDFADPLTVTVWLDKEDMGAENLNADGTPAMSLITGYQASDGWKFERLPTDRTIDPETSLGILTAQVQTLAPKDPMWAGRP